MVCMIEDPFCSLRVKGRKIISPHCMSAETTDQAACRTLFNILVKVPTDRRLEAAGAALEIVERNLGMESPLYRTVKTLHVVCLVHQCVTQQKEQP